MSVCLCMRMHACVYMSCVSVCAYACIFCVFLCVIQNEMVMQVPINPLPVDHQIGSLL